MRSLIVVMLGLVLGACGDKKDKPLERPQSARVSAERPREQAYDDKVEALRRLIKAGELEAGLKAARELVDDHRLDSGGWVVIATAYQVVDNGEEALRAAKVAAERDPKNADAWVAVGAAERSLGHPAVAEAALRRALELDPKSRAARFNLAGLAADKGQHELARKELTALVEADPDDFETRYLLATTFLDQKELGPAKEQLARIIERYPQHFRAQRTLAAIAWAEGNYKKAFERATIAGRLQADDPETARLLEGSFYIVAAARLVCTAGARPWPPDKVVAVLTQLEKDDGLDGAASFVELDERFGNDAVVQGRVAKAAAAAGCAVPGAKGGEGTTMALPDTRAPAATPDATP